MSSEAMQPKHETFRLSELRDLVATGRVRIPDFQRSFRWTNQDVVALFDSLHHGYPIGNLLMWKRDAPEHRVIVGSIEIDAPRRSDALWLVESAAVESLELSSSFEHAPRTNEPANVRAIKGIGRTSERFTETPIQKYEQCRPKVYGRG